MGSGSETTTGNWGALRRMALLHLCDLRRSHPNWDLEDLQRHLDLPATRLLLDLAQQAGFLRSEGITARQENQILRSLLRGVFSPERIAEEARLSPQAVMEFLNANHLGFGTGAYGQVPWGQASGVPAGGADRKARRVSRKGQLWYGGRVYGLGAAYAGEVCWVEEAGDRLLVHCPGRPGVAIHKKA